MEKKLKEKRQNLQALLQQRVSQLQNAEGIRNQLTNEVLELRGKLQMIEELLGETKEKETETKPEEEK